MKTRVIATFMVLVLLLVTSPASSAQGDKFLNRFQGNWEGEGKAFGGAAHLRIKWEWVLENKFLRLNLTTEISAANGAKQKFEGQAYYRLESENKYVAHWFDSRGVSFPIKAEAEGNTLTALWGSPETEQGKSTYRLIDETTMEVVDSVRQKDGTFREFRRAIVKRM